MVPKCTKSSADIASKRPHQVIGMETKINVINDYKDGISMIVIVHQSDMSHFTIALILTNKKKMMKAVKESASLTVSRLTKIREGPVSDVA